jgi:hypothetical protein
MMGVEFLCFFETNSPSSNCPKGVQECRKFFADIGGWTGNSSYDEIIDVDRGIQENLG